MELSDITPELCSVDEIPELAPLNDRQRNFCVFYVANGGNGADAARKAGYSEKTSTQTGHAIAHKKHVREAIKAVRDWYFRSLIIEKNEALAILSQFARGNLASVLDDDGEINGSKVKKAGRIVESYDVKVIEGQNGISVSKKVKLHDPRAAIDTLAKIAGWYREDLKLKIGDVEFSMAYGER